MYYSLHFNSPCSYDIQTRDTKIIFKFFILIPLILILAIFSLLILFPNKGYKLWIIPKSLTNI